MSMHILVAEDHHIVQTGIKMLLKDFQPEAQLTFVGNFDQALKKTKETFFDLLVLDLGIPGGKNIGIINTFSSISPHTKILVFSSYEENLYAIMCLKAGAHGYLSKEAPEGELIKAIRKILKGGKYVSEKVQEDLINSMNDPKQGQEVNPLQTLSEREMDVMKLLIQGESTKTISHTLNLQPSTVSTYKNRLFQKLKVKNLVQLIEKVNSLEVQ